MKFLWWVWPAIWLATIVCGALLWPATVSVSSPSPGPAFPPPSPTLTPLGRPRVLVILIGQARGSEYAWRSLHKHLLRPYKAHLATYFTDAAPHTILQEMAQYNWSVPEYENWGVVLDQLSAERCPGSDWRKLCQLQDQFLGGCGCHPASSGILFAYRYLVSKKLDELGLWNQYDFFVLSRADEIHLCDHAPFASFNNRTAWMPPGEDYGGISDRHSVGSPYIFRKMIGVTETMVCETERVFDRLKATNDPSINIEKVLKSLWQLDGLAISEFPRSVFTVKLPSDPTRWGQGEQHDVLGKFGLLVKYPLELVAATEHCKVDVYTELKSLESYDWRI